MSDQGPDTPDARGLPSAETLRRAVEIYLRAAYQVSPGPGAEKLPPEGDFDVAAWLMGGAAEPTPPDAPVEQVRSFAMRLGNDLYPHMKLRLSRPPRHRGFVFSVDCHDAFLNAQPGSSDYEALEELKRYNAELARKIHAELEDAGLPTERQYLRQEIRRARQERDQP